MTRTIRLRTLGDCAIEIGDTRIGPDSAVLFALLLYLAMERARPTPRARLRELLWPDIPEEKAWHALRQLLYRIRKLGVEIEAAAGHVRLVAEVEADYEGWDPSMPHAATGLQSSGTLRGFLNSYTADGSPTFEEWIEAQRARVHGRLRHTLLAAIGVARREGRWQLIEQCSQALLSFDPLNEEATLALAEAAALSGNKVRALEVIDRYAAEVGGDARDSLRLSPMLLRRRIAERLPERAPDSGTHARFVGRRDAMQALQEALQRTRTGRSETLVICGPAGIGKSRLVEEFSRAAVLQGVRAERTSCRMSDRLRPLSLWADLIPRILTLPGALGCAPESLESLREFVTGSSRRPVTMRPGDAHFLPAALQGAVRDLLDAVTSEASLLVVVDDLHAADARSRSFLDDIAAWADRRPLMVLCTSRVRREKPLGAMSQYDLGPMSVADIRCMVEELAKPGELSGPDLETIARLSEGNPFFARELTTHVCKTGTLQTLPSSIASLVDRRVGGLSPHAALTLSTIALLEGQATHARLDSALSYPRHRLISSLRELEAARLIALEADTIVCSHDIIAEASLRPLGLITSQAIHRSIAGALERETGERDIAGRVWKCAVHWMNAGERDRAVEYGLQCASQLLALGLAREVADLAQRLLAICSGDEQRIRLLHTQALAHYSALEWAAAHAATTEKRRLHSSANASANGHDDDELMMLECTWRTDPVSYAPILLSGMKCVRAPTATPRHRVAAAIECLKMAGNQSDAETAAAVYEEVQTIRTSSSVDPALLAEVDMLYHSTFGDVYIGSAAARSLVVHRRVEGRAASLWSALANAATSLLLAGLRQESETFLMEGLRIVTAHRFQPAILFVYDNLVFSSIVADDFDGAERWFCEIYRKLPAADSYSKIGLLACGVDIALEQQRLAEAHDRWELLGGKEISSNFPRGEASLLSIRVRLQLAMTGVPASERDIDLLTRHHLALRRYGGHDRITLALLEALLSRRRIDPARQLYDEYVTRLRREQLPLGAALTQLECRLRDTSAG